MPDPPAPKGKLPTWAYLAAAGVGLVLALFLGKKGSSAASQEAQASPDLQSIAQNLIDALAAGVQQTFPAIVPPPAANVSTQTVQVASAAHGGADNNGAVSSNGGSSQSDSPPPRPQPTYAPSPPVISTRAVEIPGIGYVSTPAFEGSNARFGSGRAVD